MLENAMRYLEAAYTNHDGSWKSKDTADAHRKLVSAFKDVNRSARYYAPTQFTYQYKPVEWKNQNYRPPAKTHPVEPRFPRIAAIMDKLHRTARVWKGK